MLVSMVLSPGLWCLHALSSSDSVPLITCSRSKIRSTTLISKQRAIWFKDPLSSACIAPTLRKFCIAPMTSRTKSKSYVAPQNEYTFVNTSSYTLKYDRQCPSTLSTPTLTMNSTCEELPRESSNRSFTASNLIDSSRDRISTTVATTFDWQRCSTLARFSAMTHSSRITFLRISLDDSLSSMRSMARSWCCTRYSYCRSSTFTKSSMVLSAVSLTRSDRSHNSFTTCSSTCGSGTPGRTRRRALQQLHLTSSSSQRTIISATFWSAGLSRSNTGSLSNGCVFPNKMLRVQLIPRIRPRLAWALTKRINTGMQLLARKKSRTSGLSLAITPMHKTACCRTSSTTDPLRSTSRSVGTIFSVTRIFLKNILEG
mmetsp:Transcript_17717/g.49862  ORF Transcript_17717/g.49862 Transcript_17717/m.49862 type:complete len:371 (-) Transcript_17717:893-2005(-)